MKYKNINKLQEIYDSNISRPGLERVIELLRLLGNPQDKLKCIHVAGTNGKGSTCAYVESILRKAEYKTALFTSPHINSLNDYFKINDQLITNEQLNNYAGEVLNTCYTMTQNGYKHPTFFEIIVAIVFKYFYEQQVDIAIIEVGLGGKDDATNIITPILSVITTIGLDHTAILGDTIKKISNHKAGIIKKNVPVIVAPMQHKEAIQVFSKRCSKLESKYIEAGSYQVKQIDSSMELQHFMVYQDKEIYDIHLQSLGRHQVNNARTAIACVKELNNLGYVVTLEDIENGLSQTHLENRIEWIEKKNIIIDASHNPQGVRELRKVVDNHLKEKKIILVCSILSTKDADSMIKEYKKFVDYAYITSSSNSFSLNANELSDLFTKYGISNMACVSTDEAMKLAINVCKKRDVVLIVSGSIYLINDIRKSLS